MCYRTEYKDTLRAIKIAVSRNHIVASPCIQKKSVNWTFPVGLSFAFF